MANDAGIEYSDTELGALRDWDPEAFQRAMALKYPVQAPIEIPKVVEKAAAPAPRYVSRADLAEYARQSSDTTRIRGGD